MQPTLPAVPPRPPADVDPGGMMQALLALFAVAATPSLAPSKVFSAFDFGAAGTGKGNDTAAIQRTLDAAAAAGGGVAWLPSNGTFLIGGGLSAIGHSYDGVTLRVDGAVTVPGPPQAAWSTRAECGMSTNRRGSGGIPRSLCSVLVVINVDGFTFTGFGSFTGFLFDEHKVPVPAGGGGFWFVNVSNALVENLRLSHFSGMMWVHFSQHVMVRNVTLFNRNNPEETVSGPMAKEVAPNRPLLARLRVVRA